MQNYISDKEPSIKDFISHLNLKSFNTKQELSENRHIAQNIKISLREIDHLQNDSYNEITNFTLNLVEKLDKSLKTCINEMNSDATMIKHQLFQINQGKIELEQNILILDSRVRESERRIGIDLAFPNMR